MEGQIITDVNLSELTHFHLKKHSTLTLHLYTKPQPIQQASSKKGKSNPDDNKRKGNYSVYGMDKVNDLSTNLKQSRLVYFADSRDFVSGFEISKSLMKSTEKITLCADYIPLNFCVCSPYLLKYCSNKKHSFLSFFVFSLFSNL